MTTDRLRDGLIYYALDATRKAQYLKIGFTGDLRTRSAALKGITSSGQTPLILALEAGTMSVEQIRHQQFADLRSHGEWFSYDGDLRTLVADMEHPFSYLLDRPHLWRFAAGWGPLAVASRSQAPAQSPQTEPLYHPVEF